jgi:hypothetical protein
VLDELAGLGLPQAPTAALTCPDCAGVLGLMPLGAAARAALGAAGLPLPLALAGVLLASLALALATAPREDELLAPPALDEGAACVPWCTRKDGSLASALAFDGEGPMGVWRPLVVLGLGGGGPPGGVSGAGRLGFAEAAGSEPEAVLLSPGSSPAPSPLAEPLGLPFFFGAMAGAEKGKTREGPERCAAVSSAPVSRDGIGACRWSLPWGPLKVLKKVTWMIGSSWTKLKTDAPTGILNKVRAGTKYSLPS